MWYTKPGFIRTLPLHSFPESWKSNLEAPIYWSPAPIYWSPLMFLTDFASQNPGRAFFKNTFPHNTQGEHRRRWHRQLLRYPGSQRNSSSAWVWPRFSSARRLQRIWGRWHQSYLYICACNSILQPSPSSCLPLPDLRAFQPTRHFPLFQPKP